MAKVIGESRDGALGDAAPFAKGARASPSARRGRSQGSAKGVSQTPGVSRRSIPSREGKRESGVPGAGQTIRAAKLARAMDKDAQMMTTAFNGQHGRRAGNRLPARALARKRYFASHARYYPLMMSTTFLSVGFTISTSLLNIAY
jgi:hypothetical protein